MSISIVKLDNPIRSYDWGSQSAIAALQGRELAPGPEAELWVGDHPTAPSGVVLPDGNVPLPAWTSRNPRSVLGPGRDQLPFLVKVLAAARSLSVQVHPNRDQAAAGLARELAAGHRDAERCYPDPYPKHEILIALSRFEAMCGFRSDAETCPLLAGFPSLAGATSEPGELPVSVQLFFRLRSLGAEARLQLDRDLEAYGRGESLEARWTSRLAAEHPGDPLAIAPLLLNPVILEPGEALIVRPGTVHSYVSGTGVEVMTPSDNVIRGGLTSKHVDQDELAVVTRPVAGPPETTHAEASGPGSTSYATGTDEFQIEVKSLGDGATMEVEGGRVTILLCIEGSVRAQEGDVEVSLRGGEAALVPAGLDRYRLLGGAAASKVFVVSSR